MALWRMLDMPPGDPQLSLWEQAGLLQMQEPTMEHGPGLASRQEWKCRVRGLKSKADVPRLTRIAQSVVSLKEEHRVDTATGDALDWIGIEAGLHRVMDEPDEAYRQRIRDFLRRWPR